jgi:8-oxo-dGTP pyrophosphatase MutT (NUDIX family)
MEPKLYGIGTTIYAERDGMILLLKRAAGAATGSWYLPGGVLEPDELPEDCALRELQEESGLVPTGPLRLISVIPMFVYGVDTFLIEFACACDAGEVALSDEHSAHRWIDPGEWRNKYLSDERLAQAASISASLGKMSRAIRSGLDRYLQSRDAA